MVFYQWVSTIQEWESLPISLSPCVVVSHLSRLRPRGDLQDSEYKIGAEEERAEKRKHREAVPHQQLQD